MQVIPFGNAAGISPPSITLAPVGIILASTVHRFFTVIIVPSGRALASGKAKKLSTAGKTSKICIDLGRIGVAAPIAAEVRPKPTGVLVN